MAGETELTGKRVTVMGLGRFGGGVGVTRWLCAQGADVLVTDLDPADKLGEPLEAIRPLVERGQVRLRLGEHNVSDFTTCDLVVANVAVPKPWENRFLRAAEAATIPITTEIALLIERLPEHARGRTVGVTGSVGKSTTAAMIHHALQAAATKRGASERVLLGGNIGGSLLGELGAIDERTWIVLELSSAMLYWLDRTLGRRAPWSPGVAVVTNVAANHIDWHGDFSHYRDSKRALLSHQHRGDSAVLGAGVWDWRSGTPARAAVVDAGAFKHEMKLPGTHNRENAAAALLACGMAMSDVPIDVFETAIAGFGGLAHRLQLVAEIELGGPGRERTRFYNDSKSTTPESCLKAIEAIETAVAAPSSGPASGRVHLIAGGYDKGADLTPIARSAARLGGLYTIGKTGPGLAAAAAPNAEHCETLERAFAAAVRRLEPGDALLLSPGCASWDQFTNFEQRGEAFVRLVEGLRK